MDQIDDDTFYKELNKLTTFHNSNNFDNYYLHVLPTSRKNNICQLYLRKSVSYKTTFPSEEDNFKNKIKSVSA